MRRFMALSAIWLCVVLFVSHTVFAAAALLREGSKGEAVRVLQTKLIELEYLKGKPSGVFDKATKEAVRKFQRDRNIEVDGICGPQTQAELKKKNLKKAPEAAKETEAREKAEQEAAKKKAAQDEELYKAAVREGKSITVTAGVIAVDPSFIPIGTRVYIPGYGEAIAEDIGGAIVGNIIDIAFDTHEEAIEFGRQELEIYILE